MPLANIWEFLVSDIGGAVVWDEVLKPILKGAVEKHGDKMGQVVYDKFFTDKIRAKLQDYFRLLSERGESGRAAYQRLRARQERHQRDNTENFFVEMLGKVVLTFDGEDPEAALDILEWAGAMSDDEFNAFLEALNHDAFLQVLKRLGGHIRFVWSRIYSSDLNAPGLWQRTNQSVDQWANPFLNRWEGNLRARQQERRQRMDARRFVW